MGILTGKRRLDRAKKLMRHAIKDYNRAMRYSQRKEITLGKVDRLCEGLSKEDKVIHAIEIEKITRNLNKYSV